MARVALLFAHHGAPPDGEPPAVTPVAGVTVVERQVRQARAGGAERVLVVVERMPPRLAAALARADVEVVRAGSLSVDDADEVLVLADSLVVDAQAVAAVQARGAPAIAVWKGRGAPDGAERIDSATHWAGIALCDGRLLARVVASLGEWDLQATLVRMLCAEERPARVDIGALGAEASAWMLVGSADAGEATRRELGAGDDERRDWPSRVAHAPIERLLLPPLLARGVAARPLALAGDALLVAAAVVLLLGAPLAGLLLALLSGPIAGLARRIAHARQEPLAGGRIGLACDALFWLALAGFLARAHDPVGAFALAVLIVVSAAGLELIEAGCLSAAAKPLDAVAPDGRRLRLWGAHRNARRWALLPFGAFGLWWIGAAIVAVYAAATHLYAQRQAWRGLAAVRHESRRERRDAPVAAQPADGQLPFPPLSLK